MWTTGRYIPIPQEAHELRGLDKQPRSSTLPLTDAYSPRLKANRFSINQPWKEQTFRQKWLGGTRMTLRLWVTVSALVLIANISWFVWAQTKYKPVGGYGILQQGSCNTAQNLNRWLHLIINVLSTLLLLASVAFMNAAAAPSEEEMRLAHRSGSWVNVGLLGFRNIRAISVKKTIIVGILALTSVPIHLLFNSVIFPALAGNDYLWAVTTEAFVGGAHFNLSESNYNVSFRDNSYELFNNFTDFSTARISDMYLNIQADLDQYERLDNLDCLREYSHKLVYYHRNLILVSSTINSTNSVLVWYYSLIDNQGTENPTNWICSHGLAQSEYACNPDPFLSNPANWTVFENPVLYCLAEKKEAFCSVKYSVTLAVIVITCNFIKLGVEIYVLFWSDLNEAITCVGDAIAASLANPDTVLENMSLFDDTKLLPDFLKTPAQQRMPVQYRPSTPRWGAAVTRKRWMFSIVFLLIIVSLVASLFAWGVSSMAGKGFGSDMTSLWNLGFGNINPELLITSDNFGTPETLSLLANTPQLILAVIYYMYGGMLTALFTAREQAKFGSQEQYLRVARPVGKQQGTWILGMPFVWGVFFQAIQTVLHWFVSQGFFVVDVSVYNIDGSLNDLFGSISNCGYSPFPILCTMIVVVVMMLIIVCLGLQRMPARCPPVAGPNSALIVAACQPRSRWDERLPYLPLKWGCIETDMYGVGHCSFVLAEDKPSAQTLVEGKWYR